MKKIFTLGIVAVAAFTLITNCSKQEDIIYGGDSELGSFAITANLSTKTVNDGLNTKWEADDKLNVFHAEASSTTYVNDGQFGTTASDKDAGVFRGDVATPLESGKTYDWYVTYPYDADLSTPANTSRYRYIGKRSDQAQVQTGNNSKSHLAGDNLPMFGKATGVAYNASPSIEMNHLSSVIEIQVTNKSTTPITVNSASFAAPEGVNIVGTFIMNYSANPVTYTDGPYVGNVATLNVNSGEEIPVNGTASFFMAIKPFTATAGQTIKLSVNGYEKSLTLTGNAQFKAGKIKRLTFNFDREKQIYQRVTSINAFEAGGKYLFALQDGVSTSTYYFLNNGGSGTNLGTDVTVSENSITDPAATYVFTAEASGSLFKFKNVSGGYIYHSGSGTTLNTNGGAADWFVSALDGGYFKFSLGNSSGRYIGAKSTTPTAVGGYANSNFVNQHSGTAAAVAQYSGAWTVFRLGGYTPVAGIANAVVSDVPARGASGQTVDVTLTNYASAPTLTAIPDGTIITAASVTAVSATSATITYTIADNVSSDARAGTITVSDTDSHSGTITVNQVAAVFSVTRTSVDLNANAGAYTTVKVDSDFDWTIDDSSLSGFTVSPNSFTYNGDKSQTVTITATSMNASLNANNLGSFVVKRTADNSELSIEVSQKSAKLAAPSLTITPDSANNKFTVSWSAVGNAAKYEYYVLDEDANYKVPITQTADATTRSFEVTSITLNKEYVVSVKAVGDNNPWIDSDESNQTVKVTGATREVISGTFTFANDKLSLTTTSGITITQEKVSGSTNVNNSYNTATTLRVYVGHKLTFSGKTITKIEFTHTSSYKGSDGISSDVGQYTQGDSASSWTGSATSVSITNAGGKTTRQLRPTQIVVYYE